jgi:hypothetical protein
MGRQTGIRRKVLLTAPATGHNRGGECGIKRPLLYLSKKDKVSSPQKNG